MDLQGFYLPSKVLQIHFDIGEKPAPILKILITAFNFIKVALATGNKI